MRKRNPVYKRDLQPGDCISGLQLLLKQLGTNVIEPGWNVELSDRNHLILQGETKIVVTLSILT